MIKLALLILGVVVLYGLKLWYQYTPPPPTPLDKSLGALDNLLENTPKDILDEKFNRISNMEFDGPTVEEYFKFNNKLCEGCKGRLGTIYENINGLCECTFKPVSTFNINKTTKHE
jgi:hypothetical protein